MATTERDGYPREVVLITAGWLVAMLLAGLLLIRYGGLLENLAV
jgi:hypothetical protein